MTSEAREASADHGKPVKLFRFLRSALSWNYTSADRDIVFDGVTYHAAAIAHTEIQDTNEPNQLQITVTCPKTLDVAGNWRPFPPTETIALTIWTQEQGETDYLVDWTGRITAAKFDDSLLTLTSIPSIANARRGNRGRVFSRGCDLMLYSQGTGMCNVDRAAHALPATLTAVNALTLTAAEFATLPDGRLAGGEIEWTRPDGLTERRSISSHTGTSITINYGGGAELASGLAVTAYPGCNQTWADCQYYNNTDNYGGELWMPGRNFYDGNPVVGGE